MGKEQLPRLRMNSDGSVSVVSWGCLDTRNVLVEVPSQRGRYLFTSPAVLAVACTNCHAEIGEPCKGHQTQDGYGVATHVKREHAYQTLVRNQGVCLRSAYQ